MEPNMFQSMKFYEAASIIRQVEQAVLVIENDELIEAACKASSLMAQAKRQDVYVSTLMAANTFSAFALAANFIECWSRSARGFGFN